MHNSGFSLLMQRGAAQRRRTSSSISGRESFSLSSSSPAVPRQSDNSRSSTPHSSNTSSKCLWGVSRPSRTPEEDMFLTWMLQRVLNKLYQRQGLL
jgi:hypothetical protein